MTGTENESVAAIESLLNSVEHALERLRLGTYRSCQACGASIPEGDLEADPVLAHCAAHPELS